tara:strand:+ start:325 stop:465 length:141 start_codon:yes stop_codon:yes gene_type:complete
MTVKKQAKYNKNDPDPKRRPPVVNTYVRKVKSQEAPAPAPEPEPEE